MSFSFGTTSATSTVPASGGFSFGSTTTTAPSGGFSFGSTNTATPANTAAPSTGGFSFGSTSTTAPVTSTTPATGAFSFGSTATPATTAAPATGGFSFGSSTTPATTGGFSFGSAPASTTSAPSTGGFSFGSTATTAPAATGGFSFGNTTTPATTTPATGGFSFGNSATTAPATGGFSFGNTAAVPATGVPANAVQNPEASNSIPTNHYMMGDPIVERINDLSAAYDHGSKRCRFQTIVYNKVPNAYRSKLMKPPHANDEVWDKGVLNNPDPENLTPCLLVGFSDLSLRVEEQKKAMVGYNNLLSVLSEKVNDIKVAQSKYQVDLAKVKAQEQNVHHRILRLMNKLQLYRSQDVPLMNTEQDYNNKLKLLQQELTKPGFYGSKLHELQSILTMGDSIDDSVGRDDRIANDVEKNLPKLYEILDMHRQYILALTNEIKNNKSDIDDVTHVVEVSK